MRRRIATLGTSRYKPAICPYCGATIDAATGVGFDSFIAPRLRAGDHSVCRYCTKVMRYDGRIFHRVPSLVARAYYEKHPWLKSWRDDHLKTEVTSVTGKRKEMTN